MVINSCNTCFLLEDAGSIPSNHAENNETNSSFYGHQKDEART